MIYFVIGFYLLFLAFKYDVYGSKNESAKKISLLLCPYHTYPFGGTPL